MTIRVVDIQPSSVAELLTRLRGAFPAARVDAELGRREARRSQDTLRGMGRDALADLRAPDVDHVVFFEAATADGGAHVSTLLWPEDEELALAVSSVDDERCWTLAERIADALGGTMEDE